MSALALTGLLSLLVGNTVVTTLIWTRDSGQAHINAFVGLCLAIAIIITYG